MKSYPIVAVRHPLDHEADLLLLGMLAESDLADFRSEVAHELGALLGIDRQAALSFVDLDVDDAISLPTPDCFELSAQTRRAFAAEVAKALRFALGGERSVAA